MNVVGYDDTDDDDDHSINSDFTAVSSSVVGSDQGDFPVPPFRMLAHNRAHEAEMDEQIKNFYDGLENSGENWQNYFDTVWQNLTDASDIIDGVVDSPYAGWEIYWNQFLDNLYTHEAPFWGVNIPEMVRPTAEWIWDQHTQPLPNTFGAAAAQQEPQGEGWGGLKIPHRFL